VAFENCLSGVLARRVIDPLGKRSRF